MYVCAYRYFAPVPETDAKRAVRTVRSRSHGHKVQNTHTCMHVRMLGWAWCGYQNDTPPCTPLRSPTKRAHMQVGFVGSSAGGHLAATVMAYHDAGNPDAADPVERKR